MKKVSDLEEAEKENISNVSKETPVAIVPVAVPPPTGPACTSVPHSQDPIEVKSRFISFPDMKPEKLLKGAALKQIETFVQTFEHYMAQGYSGSDIPSNAVYLVLLLVIDSSWKMALEEKGLLAETTLKKVKVKN